MTDTDALLATSLCQVKRVIMTGPCSQDTSSNSILKRISTLSGLKKIASEGEKQATKVEEVLVKNLEGV